MIKTKTFDLIDYSNNLSDFSDNFWHNKLEADIIHFITREKEVPKDNLRIIISHPYEGNVIIVENMYLFHYLHEICVQLRINPEHIKLITSNWQIFKQYIEWKKTHFSDMPNLDLQVDFLLAKIYAPKLFDIRNKNNIVPELNYETIPDEPVYDKPFVYNSLNKQPNRHRMHLYQLLMEKQLIHKGIVTFNKAGNTTLTGKLPEHLINQLPITYDVNEQTDEKIMSYGDIEFTEAIESSSLAKVNNPFAQFYRQTNVTLVTETLLGNMNNEYNDCSSRIPHHNGCVALMDYNVTANRMICPVCQSQKVNVPEWVKYYYCGFITEKTFRQFLNGHPMLWVAPKHTIKMLKHLGFKTFDVAWKEDYDDIIDPVERINRVITILTDLCNKTPNEWHVLNRKLTPILKHNQEIMLNLSEIPSLTWKNYPKFD